MSKIIMVANQKGGVGKTTVSFELSAMYAQKGFKVLTIDLDGQRDFSKYAKADFRNKPNIRTILWAIKRLIDNMDETEDYDTQHILGENPDYFNSDYDVISNAIQHSDEGFDFIAASNYLDNANIEFHDVTDITLLKMLMKYLSEYDYIFLDCAPARSSILQMAYVASNYCLIVAEADPFSIGGVFELAKDIKSFNNKDMAECYILGIIVNKDDATNGQIDSYRELCEKGQKYDILPFETTINRSCAATDAKKAYMSISCFAKQTRENKRKSKSILNAFDSLYHEINNKISELEEG